MKALGHFKRTTLSEDREQYQQQVWREYRRRLTALGEDYEVQLEKAQRLEIKAHELDKEITRLEDRIANKADKDFGSERVWRVSRALLKKVVKRMDEASEHLREKQERWRSEAKKLKRDFNREVNALTRLYKRAMLSVQRT